MVATRDELREHLTAVIAAAQELPAEDRPYLADTFLDELETQFLLTPRSLATPESGARSAHAGLQGVRSSWGPVPIGVVIVLSLLVFPFLMMSVFVLVHPPVFLVGLVFLLLFRFGRSGMRRRAPWRPGSRGGTMSPFNR